MKLLSEKRTLRLDFLLAHETERFIFRNRVCCNLEV